jgi:hypothetical protein
MGMAIASSFGAIVSFFATRVLRWKTDCYLVRFVQWQHRT